MSQATVTTVSSAVVESDPAQRSQAMLAHLLGIFGILGTGIYYLVKKNDPRAGTFVKSQIKESFNFQMLAFCVFVVANITTIVLSMVSTILGTVASFGLLLVGITVLVLVIQNAMKANRGEVATYKWKLNVLK